MKIFDDTFAGLEKAMDLTFKRHVLLSSNTANSETPNYRARELDFAGELQRALGDTSNDLRKTNPKHMDVSSLEGSHIVFDNTGEMGSDGNNVDLDINMGKISANSRSYESAAGLVAQKLKLMRSFIRKGV